MEAYQFTCPECRREIEFADAQREAALASGCPVCGAPVDIEHFA